MIKKMVIACLAALVVLLPGLSQAESITYYLDVNNAGITGGPWGSITLEEINPYTVTFTVDPYAAAFTSIANFGLQSFGFNESTGGQGSQLTLSTVTGWTWSYQEDHLSGYGPYGQFDLEYTGTGRNRLDPLTFTVSVSENAFTINLATFTTELSTRGYLFAGHIAGFTVDGNSATSAMFSTSGESAVPEPGTLILLGTGLLGLGVVRRKKPVKK